MALGRSGCMPHPAAATHPTTHPTRQWSGRGRGTDAPPPHGDAAPGGPSNAHACEKAILKLPQGGRYQARDDIQNHLPVHGSMYRQLPVRDQTRSAHTERVHQSPDRGLTRQRPYLAHSVCRQHPLARLSSHATFFPPCNCPEKPTA